MKSIDTYEARRAADTVLVDVRTAQEYRAGHLPQSVNVPLDRMEMVR